MNNKQNTLFLKIQTVRQKMLSALNSPQFNSQHIICNSRRIMPLNNCINVIKPRVPIKIKGLVLSALANKYKNKNNMKNDQKRALLLWNAKTKSDKIKPQAIVRILTQQQTSESTFLYRIKAFCQLQQDKKKIQQELLQIAQQKQKQKADQIRKKQIQSKKIENNKKIEQKPKQKPAQSKNSLKVKDKILQPPCLQKSSIALTPNSILLRGHLRQISQQLSIPLSSQRDVSNYDILQMFDKKLGSIEARIRVSGLRTCQLLCDRISYKLKRDAFDKILQQY